ncbi:unnamed protein product [Clavelina lepadiformis]|uniref:Uncharacterized protein n=1 Tax=Clavelina lepadiformis TaxID=159417 RepID=A0ABP0FNT7_CLALP
MFTRLFSMKGASGVRNQHLLGKRQAHYHLAMAPFTAASKRSVVSPVSVAPLLDAVSPLRALDYELVQQHNGSMSLWRNRLARSAVNRKVRDNPHNLITLKNGEKITLSNWQPGFRMTTDPEADRVVMTVQFTDNENKGISNRLPSLDIVVPLCSRAI